MLLGNVDVSVCFVYIIVGDTLLLDKFQKKAWVEADLYTWNSIKSQCYQVFKW